MPAEPSMETRVELDRFVLNPGTVCLTYDIAGERPRTRTMTVDEAIAVIARVDAKTLAEPLTPDDLDPYLKTTMDAFAERKHPGHSFFEATLLMIFHHPDHGASSRAEFAEMLRREGRAHIVFVAGRMPDGSYAFTSCIFGDTLGKFPPRGPTDKRC